MAKVRLARMLKGVRGEGLGTPRSDGSPGHGPNWWVPQAREDSEGPTAMMVSAQ